MSRGKKGWRYLIRKDMKGDNHQDDEGSQSFCGDHNRCAIPVGRLRLFRVDPVPCKEGTPQDQGEQWQADQQNPESPYFTRKPINDDLCGMRRFELNRLEGADANRTEEQYCGKDEDKINDSDDASA